VGDRGTVSAMLALSQVLLTLLYGPLGCRGATPPREPGPLVAPDAWEWVDAAEDPFSDRPSAVSCDEGAWLMEAIGPDDSLSVDTTDCDYLAVRQPALLDVEPGDELFVRLWHYDLSAGADAEAHAALWFGGALSWEDRVPIPSESGMLAPEWAAEVAVSAGEDIYFHLHNHGANSYNLIEVSVTPPQD